MTLRKLLFLPLFFRLSGNRETFLMYLFVFRSFCAIHISRPLTSIRSLISIVSRCVVRIRASKDPPESTIDERTFPSISFYHANRERSNAFNDTVPVWFARYRHRFRSRGFVLSRHDHDLKIAFRDEGATTRLRNTKPSNLSCLDASVRRVYG